MTDTFVERRLAPIGFKTVERHEARGFIVDEVVMQLGETVIKFECVCPAFPSIKGLGCSIHHEGPGDSWPVVRAEELATTK